MIKEYLQQINKKTLGSPIFYLAPYIERAEGLEDFLAHYHIITGKEDYISRCMKERGISVENIPLAKKSALAILQDEKALAYIAKNTRRSPYIMVFKNSPAIQKAAEDFILLNADAHIAGRIENKISQYKLLQDAGFESVLPKAVISRIKDTSYEALAGELGSEFVAQFDRGHSGNSTFFIESDAEFDAFKAKYVTSDIPVKFTQKLPYNFITINAVATSKGTYCGGLCTQITGLRELNAGRGETCGNNWNQENITDTIRSKAVQLTEQIGNSLYDMGFKGMFGIDFAIDGERLYVLEINARQTASVQYFTKVQIGNNQVPLLMLHLMEFLDIPFELDRGIYNEINNMPFEASVLVVRNHEETSIHIKQSFNGLYNIEDMKHKENLYNISDVYSKSRALILEAPAGEDIKPGEEFLKIVTSGNIMKDSEHLDDNILKIVQTILQDTQKVDG